MTLLSFYVRAATFYNVSARHLLTTAY